MTFNRVDDKAFMKKIIGLAFLAILCIVALINIVGYGVRAFLEPRLLSAKADYELYIQLSSTVHDFPSANPVSFSLYFNPNVWEVNQGLRAAADEPKISSALIHLDNVRLTVSQAITMGESIKYFRSKGKKVICYSASFDYVNGGWPAYLLASYCDVIQIQRLGSVSLEALKPIDILGEEAEEIQSSNLLTKIEADIDAIIRKNRGQNPSVKGKHYIDAQALNAGLIDEIVPTLTQSDHTILIQDYVRLVEKANRKKPNVVAVIPVTEAVEEGMLKAICNRPDIQAVVIHVRAKSDYIAQKIGSKPVVVYVPDHGDSLNDAIDRAYKLADLNKHIGHVEIIYPGSWMSYVMSDLSRLGKSMKSMFKRSVNYVAEMVYMTE